MNRLKVGHGTVIPPFGFPVSLVGRPNLKGVAKIGKETTFLWGEPRNGLRVGR